MENKKLKNCNQKTFNDFIRQEHRDFVVQNISTGQTHRAIMILLRAHGLDIRHNETFARHFKEEIIEGTAILESTLQNTIYKKAIAGDNASLFFALKTRFGWRETAKFTIDQAKEAKEQLEQVIEGTALGNLHAAEAKNIASIIELKERATKGNLGESIAPSVVVTPFTQEDFEQAHEEVLVENEINENKESEK